MTSMATFKPLGASIFPTQDFEVIAAKQPVLASMGACVRSVLAQMEPELNNRLLAEYGDPQPDVVRSLEASLIQRELSLDVDENELDMAYFNGATSRRMSEVGLSASDEWDSPSI